jgi:hypothetical protein
VSSRAVAFIEIELFIIKYVHLRILVCNKLHLFLGQGTGTLFAPSFNVFVSMQIVGNISINNAVRKNKCNTMHSLAVAVLIIDKIHKIEIIAFRV